MPCQASDPLHSSMIQHFLFCFVVVCSVMMKYLRFKRFSGTLFKMHFLPPNYPRIILSRSWTLLNENRLSYAKLLSSYEIRLLVNSYSLKASSSKVFE